METGEVKKIDTYNLSIFPGFHQFIHGHDGGYCSSNIYGDHINSNIL